MYCCTRTKLTSLGGEVGFAVEHRATSLCTSRTIQQLVSDAQERTNLVIANYQMQTFVGSSLNIWYLVRTSIVSPTNKQGSKSGYFSSPKVVHTDNLHKSYNATACECDAEGVCMKKYVHAQQFVCANVWYTYLELVGRLTSCSNSPSGHAAEGQHNK